MNDLKDKIKKVMADYCTALNPCPYCNNKKKKTVKEVLEKCQVCSYFYESQFELEETNE